MGASAMGADDFLKKRGYEVTTVKPMQYKVVKPGAKKPAYIHRKTLMVLLDDERRKAGLQPVTAR